MAVSVSTGLPNPHVQKAWIRSPEITRLVVWIPSMNSGQFLKGISLHASRGSCMPSLGERMLVGWSWDLHTLINPSSLCCTLRWSSCPQNPLSLPHCSALPHCGALLLLPHIPDELPGRTAKPQCLPCHSGEQQLLAAGLFSPLWIGVGKMHLYLVLRL